MNIARYDDACRRGLDWCLALQGPDGSVYMPEPCLDGTYKFPAAMMVMGRHREAGKLLGWIERELLQPNGDLSFGNTKVHDEWHRKFYLYTNSWIALGAQRSGHFRLSNCLLDYILKYQSPTTGLLQSLPLCEDTKGWCDTTITGNSGIACLFAGRLREARMAADGLQRIARQQANDARFYFRADANGNIIREIANENPLWVYLDGKAPGQCYWYVGISAALLACTYEITAERSYLESAVANVEFLLNCAPDVLNSFASGKLGYACALLYRLTGDERYRRAAATLIDWLVEVQKADGSWGPDLANYPWYFEQDCTAEMVYWIAQIAPML